MESVHDTICAPAGGQLAEREPVPENAELPPGENLLAQNTEIATPENMLPMVHPAWPSIFKTIVNPLAV